MANEVAMHRATPSYDLLDANQPRMDRVPAKTGRMLGETGAKVCRIMQGFYVVFLFSARCTHNCAVAAPGRAEIQVLANVLAAKRRAHLPRRA